MLYVNPFLHVTYIQTHFENIVTKEEIIAHDEQILLLPQMFSTLFNQHCFRLQQICCMLGRSGEFILLPKCFQKMSAANGKGFNPIPHTTNMQQLTSITSAVSDKSIARSPRATTIIARATVIFKWKPGGLLFIPVSGSPA